MTDITQTLRDRHRPAHAVRTAQSHAAFLLPHLRPGMALLDLGCGPGSITVGLAAAVAPGPTTGVDLDPNLPDGAADAVRLVRADVNDLPFPGASFDALFACALLQHVRDPLATLREARRVARPGAVIGLADADRGGYLLSPASPVLASSFDLMAKLRTGEQSVGRELRGLLARAGFVRCEAWARTAHHGTEEEARGFASFNASWFTTPQIIERVVANGWATRSELADIRDAWLAWGAEPGAFFAGFWIEAIGWVDPQT
jgi:SAM-dependent methyltransferase